MVAGKWVDLTSWIQLIFFVVMSFVILNWMCVFWILRHQSVELSSRRPKTAMIIGVAGFLAALETSYFLYIYNIRSGRQFLADVNGEMVNDMLVYIWILISHLVILYMVTFRVYMVYFNIKFQQALEDRECMLYSIHHVSIFI